MNLKQFLLGKTELKGTPIIQPHTASGPNVVFGLHSVSKWSRGSKTTSDYMSGPIVGYSNPMPVHFYGTPPVRTVTGTPAIRNTDAPAKRCK